MMLKKDRYKEECIDAWANFKPIEKVDKLPIDCIPEKPDPTKIANYGLPREDRKFKRVVPEVVVVDGVSRFKGHETPELEKELLNKFTDYRKNGYWFYNGDTLQYISGDHWYYLNVVKIKVKKLLNSGKVKRGRQHPDFVDADQLFYIAWRQCEMMPFCFGMNFLGPRRIGKTSKGCEILLNSGTWTKEAINGINAQNANFASRVFSEVVTQWQNLPDHPYFFPMHSGDNDPAKEIRFRAPRSSNKNDRSHVIHGSSLNTVIDFRATTINAYDGEDIARFLGDEVSKWTGVDINTVVEVLVETLALGPTATGKLLLTTTAENLAGRTLPNYVRLWNDSDVNKWSNFNQTPSKLNRVFISGALGYRYDPEEIPKEALKNLPKKFLQPTIDEFGNSNVELITEMLLYFREQLTGDKLISLIRKYPLSAEEALTYGQGYTPFDTVRINQQLTINEKNRVLKNDPVVRGNFEWYNPYRKVEFHPHPEGLWLVAWMPPEQDRNQWEYFNGVYRPTRNWVYTGVDSYDHKTTEDNKKSDGAGLSYCLGHPESFDRKGFVCMYVNRRPTANLFYEDMLKQAMFYSSPIILENQKYGLANWLEVKQFLGFLERDPLNPNRKNDGVSTRGDNFRIEMVNGLIAHVYSEVGNVPVKDSDNNIIDEREGWCPFDDLLLDMLNFNPAKWKKYDATVGAMLAVLSERKPEYSYSQPVMDVSDWGFNSVK